MRLASGLWLRRVAALAAVAAAMGLLAPALRADDSDDGAQPQGRAVRLSSVDGQVSLIQSGQPVADHALVNTPLFEGAQLTTADDGRAEVQFEDGSVARIPPDSSLTLTMLRPNGDTEVTLNGGMGYFEIQAGNQGGSQGSPMRVRFGSNVVTCSGFTVLRVQMDQSPGELAVFSGNAHLESAGGMQMDLHGGESATLNNYTLAESIEPDSWDAWNSDRDQALTSSEVGPSAPTSGLPNSNNPAWGDLNNNGAWYNVPDQGYVWSPYEASNPGWDPYGTGYWMNEPGYGYIFVSGEPWGYMPYQCGAWNWYNSFGWGWAPGGCSPWWGGGGWGFNIGYAPPWYRRPFRPRPGPPRPRNPRPGVNQRLASAHPVGPEPVMPILAVNRRMTPADTSLPPRDRTQPIMIGNVIANPVVNEPQRPRYNHLPVSTARPMPGPPVGVVSNRQGYARPPEGTNGRNVYMPAPYPGSGASGGSHPTYTPPRSSGSPRPAPAPGGGSRPAPAPAGGGSHPSGGGGGSHPSGGGHK